MALNEVYDDLQSLVEKELKVRNYNNSNIKLSRGTVNGDNYLAVITLIDINTSTAEGKPAKLHWIAKSAYKNKQFRENINVSFIFSQEIYVYTQILPAFEYLQRKRNLAQIFKPYPQFLASSLQNMCETVIMENLKAHRYVMKSRREPLDYNHTKFVITHYAKFHALSFALRDQYPEKFQELAGNMKSNFFSEANTDEMQTAMAATCTRALKCFTEDNKKELKLLNYLEKHAYDVITYSSNGDVAGNHAVFIHGDSWINNMLFKYENKDEPQNPTQMILLDFQLSRLGSVAADLSYFFFTCTDGELREKHYEELLQHYYQVFSDFLIELGSDPKKLFPYDIFVEHMKKFSAYGILMAMMVLHLMLSDSDEVPNIAESQSEVDMEAWRYETRNVDLYLARVKDVIRDVFKYECDMYTKE